eukprot:CAMPEP_0113298668 /NCGR_PEP_ID=MMETSP0010_2-20120614/1018_1 /TAXON_ID=216773 ORGANISM="Corethron hystrix, Strain 308" /NCGR_SAMPLE_ID=MMETSP0010_2 /ASSEMBLY_ACC=CAM_ASM_000155 /LENGTH=329 /DNA_ID=CAMNT_0000151763 /DNA_START=76 /DNA_END=1062 /DNA_ORIENTATION=+ /assembly_acc=CAM_ASM_000155
MFRHHRPLFYGYIVFLYRHVSAFNILSTFLSPTFRTLPWGGVVSHSRHIPSTARHAAQATALELVEEEEEEVLLRFVREKKISEAPDDGGSEDCIRALVSKLEGRSDTDAESKAGGDLFGLYDVDLVLPKDRGASSNAAGGKWVRKGGVAQKILRTERTMQHLIAPEDASRRFGRALLESGKGGKEAADAEAVNVIVLRGIFNLLIITVILRGDAVRLSEEERTEMTGRSGNTLTSEAVRAYFDKPLIHFQLGSSTSTKPTHRGVAICLGPPSSVVLDTPYVGKKLRLGVGGTSGTRFIFRRLADDEGIETRGNSDASASIDFLRPGRW